MRTNIDLDDKLMAEAMTTLGLTTKKATVEEALRRIVRAEQQKQALREMAKIGWGDGDLDALRGPPAQ